ncbi:Hypothetical glutamic acid-rich region containing protein [Cavenderia fasciculata]|uniref:Hypothetical glutamic acid-rich region containing protein n=1 Tax=Cavenderia fasciculata TaxID=261658 RepID=F4PSI9_CACFS|nr:putative glutamic acid-rich region containing protein [Cavenderia fasciculata]EGG21519.1 Hypothetical glutamic acid-rich region containing protein [Cavenderia fasciculata]|eukprot:XP_004359369.1 Hypothetical glutamic acid-rich region containing protein [Cavenderia fasciculata]
MAGGAKSKKPKLSKKISKKYTTHKHYYLDTAENAKDLSIRSRGQKRDEKFQAMSDKYNASQKRREEYLQEQQRKDILDKLQKELKTGSASKHKLLDPTVLKQKNDDENMENIYEVGPSSYQLLMSSFKPKKIDSSTTTTSTSSSAVVGKRKPQTQQVSDSEDDDEEDEEDEQEGQDDDQEESGEENDIQLSEGEDEDEEVEGEEVDEDDQEDDGDQDLDDEQDEEDGEDDDDEEEEEEEQTFEDVYGSGKRQAEEDDTETRATLNEMQKKGKFQVNKRTDNYYMHFNRDGIEEWSQLDDLVEKGKSLEGTSSEMDTLGHLISSGCPSYTTLKTKQKVSSLPTEKNSFEEYNIKNRLLKPWSITKKSKDNDLYFTMLQQKLFPIMNEYRDLLYTESTPKNHRSIYQLYTLHAVNHILKSRDQLMEDNVITREAEEKSQVAPDLRHQGFTKPKVLIIVPFRNTAMDIIKLLLKMVPHQQQDANTKKSKLIHDFTLLDEEDKVNGAKPADYKYTFRDNIDDCFRIGISFKRKGVQLFQPFFHSDIIIASPLGLRLVVGTDGDKQRDYDFLSSIEVVIADQLDTILQQNWDHMNIIFDNLNRTPKKDHGTDFSRVRLPTLEGWGKYFRQTLLFGSILTPEINALFNRQCFNVSGKMRIKKIKDGEIQNVIPELMQTFHRVHIAKELNGDDSTAKLQFLTASLLPKYAESDKSAGVLVFVPGYTDFVTIRNIFKKETKSFTVASEYLAEAQDRRNRRQFNKGEKTFLLFSERYHYFHRNLIRGIKHVIFFGLPNNSQFYSELLNMVTLEKGTVMSLFTTKDKMALERIVGSVRCNRMMEGDKETYLFC